MTERLLDQRVYYTSSSFSLEMRISGGFWFVIRSSGVSTICMCGFKLNAIFIRATLTNSLSVSHIHSSTVNSFCIQCSSGSLPLSSSRIFLAFFLLGVIMFIIPICWILIRHHPLPWCSQVATTQCLLHNPDGFGGQ